VDVEVRDVLFDFESELFLGEVGVVEAAVVGAAGHAAGVADAMDETIKNRHVTDVNVVAFEIFLEDDEGSHRDGGVTRSD